MMYTLQFVVQNIRSLRQNFDLFVSELSIMSIKPDLVILTEVWIMSNEVNLYKIDGFDMFANCNDSYRSGGVVVYVRSCYRCSNVDVCSDVQSADCLKLTCHSDNVDFVLLSVYRLHSASIAQYLIDIEKLVMSCHGQNVIYTGDINLDLLSDNNIVDAYRNLLASYGLNCLVSEPTRIVGTSQTCIDHCFVRFTFKNNIQAQHVTEVQHLGISDHSMICLKIIINTTVMSNNLNDTYKLNYDALENELGLVDWNCVFVERSVSNAFSVFIDILQTTIDKCKQKVPLPKRLKNVKTSAWMTDRLYEGIRRKQKLYKLMTARPYNDKLKDYYRSFKNKLKVNIRKAKEEYYLKTFEDCAGNSREQWKVVNNLIGEGPLKKEIIEIETNTEILTNKLEIVNEFNKFFLEVPSIVRRSIINVDGRNDYDVYFTHKYMSSSMFMIPTCEKEVQQVLKSLKNNKAPGQDCINSYILKRISIHILPVLTYLFNKSMAEGEFPSCLKSAVVVPLFKSGNRKQTTCYRPISLLSVFAKLLEKIVKGRLMGFLKKYGYLSKSQFGFREALSTEDALVTFLEDIYNGLNEGKKCAALYIDITKAFDTVDHEMLLNKLWMAGVRGLPYQWFKSYLTDRKQYVRAGNCISDVGHIKFGVPQGSVLGPILFLVYVNDLCEGIFNGKITAFADDTALTYVDENINTIYEKMNLDLKLLNYWFNKNFMILSEKTKYMIFGLRCALSFNKEVVYHNVNCLNDVNCGCLRVDKVDKIKYLGLLIDSNLSWKSHISKLKGEMLRSVRTFYLLRSLCPTKVLVKVYHALVGSRLSYGLVCWGGTYVSTLYPIIVLQKSFIRILSNAHITEHSWPLFINLKILPIRNLYIFKVLKLFYTRSSANLFGENIRYQLRNLLVEVPKPNLTFFKHFYIYNAPRLFNLISFKIEKRETNFLFLINLKKVLFTLTDCEELLNTMK